MPKQFLGCMLLILATNLFVVTASAQLPPLTFPTEACPTAIAGTQYSCQLEARGGTTPRHWQITEGKLPSGFRLAVDTGLLTGVTTEVGEFTVTVAVIDSASPANQIQRKLTIRVIAAMVMKWIEAPQVRDQGVWGKVEVTNQTPNPFDLTVIILGVNEVDKAFALGYQHFTLPPGKTSPPIPFGMSLPYGQYVVNADSIAEVAAINMIYRVHMESNGKLVIQGP
jgi:hypothetical protein